VCAIIKQIRQESGYKGAKCSDHFPGSSFSFPRTEFLMFFLGLTLDIIYICTFHLMQSTVSGSNLLL
jgi:hypothetical protein